MLRLVLILMLLLFPFNSLAQSAVDILNKGSILQITKDGSYDVVYKKQLYICHITFINESKNFYEIKCRTAIEKKK